MQTKQIFSINDFENLDWKDHGFFQNAICTQIFFENGYGASIITQTNTRKATNIFDSFVSSYGSHKDGTYEVAIIKGNKNRYNFYELDNIEDVDSEDAEDYLYKSGIWANMNLEKTLNKINLIACL